ncbi:MAG: replication initiator protein A [Firmicutes bacterium]|nr:replication initiator protein A [Bacillota bacterium]
MSQYFHGEQVGNYTFFRVPKALFTNPKYKDLSTDAKLLYSLMLDRVALSTVNDWKDKCGHIYIYFTVNEIMKEMACCKQTAVNLLNELEKVALIERRKQGLGKPNRIYVKHFE